jgi:UDP-3-O-[3-hydroxymyristoyl] N-acetylglucosamine deacetylase
LSLSGAPIIGLYRTYRPGHKLNAMALEALFENRSAYQLLEAPAPTAVRARAGAGHVPAGAAAFAVVD